MSSALDSSSWELLWDGFGVLTYSPNKIIPLFLLLEPIWEHQQHTLLVSQLLQSQREAVRRRCSSSACSGASSLESWRFPCWTQDFLLIPPTSFIHQSGHLTEEVFRYEKYFSSKTYCTCHCNYSPGRWGWDSSISPCPTSDMSSGYLLSSLHARRWLRSELEKPHKFLQAQSVFYYLYRTG